MSNTTSAITFCANCGAILPSHYTTCPKIQPTIIPLDAKVFVDVPLMVKQITTLTDEISRLREELKSSNGLAYARLKSWVKATDELNLLRPEVEKLRGDLREAQEEIDSWKTDIDNTMELFYSETKRADKAEAQLAGVVEALEQIATWAKAYPLGVFPEPDFKKAHKVLKDAGMTLDSVSASNMRHVLTGITNIIDKALANLPKALKKQSP